MPPTEPPVILTLQEAIAAAAEIVSQELKVTITRVTPGERVAGDVAPVPLWAVPRGAVALADFFVRGLAKALVAAGAGALWYEADDEVFRIGAAAEPKPAE